jgi:hypothetical protein
VGCRPSPIGEVAPIPENTTGRQRKPHSRTTRAIGDETAGLAARRKTQIFEAVANGGGLAYMHSGMYGMYAFRKRRSDQRDRPNGVTPLPPELSPGARQSRGGIRPVSPLVHRIKLRAHRDVRPSRAKITLFALFSIQIADELVTFRY